MVDDTKIAEWKKTYGRVMKKSFAGLDYYFRPLTFPEYSNIQKLVQSGDSSGEMDTVKVGVLSPEITSSTPAAVVVDLSDRILTLSGFSEVETEPVEL